MAINGKVFVHTYTRAEIIRQASSLLAAVTNEYDRIAFFDTLSADLLGASCSMDPNEFIEILDKGSAEDLLSFLLGDDCMPYILSAAEHAYDSGEDEYEADGDSRSY